MTEQSRGENIKLELELGGEAREEARILLDGNRPKGAISRTYYFLFHFVRALLYSLGLDPRTHEGAGHLFSLHFIREGKFPQEYGKLFSRLQKYREQVDYDPAQVFTREDAAEEFQKVEQFARLIDEYLSEQGYLGES